MGLLGGAVRQRHATPARLDSVCVCPPPPKTRRCARVLTGGCGGCAAAVRQASDAPGPHLHLHYALWEGLVQQRFEWRQAAYRQYLAPQAPG
jgi:hypothetical protein